MAIKERGDKKIYTCSYTGSNFTAESANSGVVVHITGWDATNERPVVAGLPTSGSPAVYGVVQSVGLPGTTRSPAGQRWVDVATGGWLKVRKDTAPAAGDVGDIITGPTTNTGTAGVSTTPTDGGKKIVGFTGTNQATDFLIVDFG